MKAYLITTGILFALVTVMHGWEIVGRGHFEVEDPIVVLVAAGLSAWAWTLNARARTS